MTDVNIVLVVTFVNLWRQYSMFGSYSRLNNWLSLFDAEILGLGPMSISSEKIVQQRNDVGSLMEKHKEGELQFH